MQIEAIQALTQFGVAGLMGILWIGERSLSRRREAQLDQTHARLMKQREELKALLDLVDRNTHVIARFDQTQRHLKQTLEKMNDTLSPSQHSR